MICRPGTGFRREDQMKKKLGLSLLAALATVALAATASVQAQVASMTFFVMMFCGFPAHILAAGDPTAWLGM